MFPDKIAYERNITSVNKSLKSHKGSDQVVIWLSKERAKKVLPSDDWNVRCSSILLEELTKILGEKNVRVLQKGLKV